MHTKTGNGHNVDLEKLVKDLKEVVRDGQELLKAGAGTAKNRALAGARETDRLAREYPYHSVSLAFGVGLLAALIACNLFRRGEPVEEEFE